MFKVSRSKYPSLFCACAAHETRRDFWSSMSAERTFRQKNHFQLATLLVVWSDRVMRALDAAIKSKLDREADCLHNCRQRGHGIGETRRLARSTLVTGSVTLSGLFKISFSWSRALQRVLGSEV
ncbi:hypothetical protein RRG08_015363 [Elysia crispata]|uniref:Uncharacterized protein n=1 Tax=Elysia crispata TaxID=231223 RepID=A0AAE1A817_9GAST|nr:hypothetical protein RRG08_015363 [Elysia crispata]